VGGIMVNIVGFVILWFIIGLIVGFITHGLNLLPPYSPWLLIITTVLTVIVFIWIKV
jgi:hypothetical protein